MTGKQKNACDKNNLVYCVSVVKGTKLKQDTDAEQIQHYNITGFSAQAYQR